MTKEELLSFCRYYKGEKANPYEGKNQNKSMLWFYENCWYIEIKRSGGSDEYFSEFIKDYISVGLEKFMEADGVPLSLKAFLFNRYSKCHYSLYDSVEPFKSFYMSYY